MTEIRVAVRDLVNFCHRSGDIDTRFTPSPSGAQGIAGHQRLYARRAAAYQPEYPVRLTRQFGSATLQLTGRADGYDAEAGLVEEIKTCRVAATSIPASVTNLHWAQGIVYGALIAMEHDLPSLNVKVTWLNIDSDEEHSEQQSWSRQALEDFLDAALLRFSQWLAQLQVLQEARNRSLQTLGFPHGEFRAGQRDIAELVYKCIDQAGQLLVEAPTGIGKTAAVLYPALKALGMGKHDKIIFTTAKTVGRIAAENTLEQLRNSGFSGQALTLTARERVCFSPGKACHGDDCPFARQYYDKLPAAMDAALQQPTLARENIEQVARAHEVCPYELARDLLPWVDVMIADVHYVYSLQGILTSAMQADQQRWSVLIDEAHNLPDRARGMFSAHFMKSRLMLAKKGAPTRIGKALNRVNRALLKLQETHLKHTGFYSVGALPEALLYSLADFCSTTSEALGEEPTFLTRLPVLMDVFFDALHFARVAEHWGEDFRLQLTRSSARQSLVVTLNCLDPARLLRQRQLPVHAVVAFSATLAPTTWARDRIGLDDGAVCLRSPSPFKPQQLSVHIKTDLDTRYRSRESTLPALALAVSQWLQQTPGNCLVYFPSYRYLNDCLERLQGRLLSRQLWVQAPGQSDEARGELLQQLEARSDVVAFCILGGALGEGIDLPGDQLSSVVVVGVGMPAVNADTRELQRWYESSGKPGFEYTFLYPGMQKIAQALGRVVRNIDDHGHALLIDTRYQEAGYRNLLPPWWEYHLQPPTVTPTPLGGTAPGEALEN
ncbi:MAG: ATP-dependent DNA helicase [Gammaproteobacteria bacterium]|nr:ATP-dependent DNA helicase [Gammaproteobacteria bacterium]